LVVRLWVEGGETLSVGGAKEALIGGNEDNVISVWPYFGCSIKSGLEHKRIGAVKRISLN